MLGLNQKNPLVGELKLDDMELLKIWAVRQLQIHIKQNKNEYKIWREYFPKSTKDNGTTEATLEDLAQVKEIHDGSTTDDNDEATIIESFIENAYCLEEIASKVFLNKSIYNLIKAMANEPGVAMLIIQMNQETPDIFDMDVPDFIYLLNKLITYAPRFLSEYSGSYTNLIVS